MKIKSYKVIKHSDVGVVAMEVDEHLGQGWQPYGEIVKDGARLYQAMVKYEEEPKEQMHTQDAKLWPNFMGEGKVIGYVVEDDLPEDMRKP